jgi:hypothetical protein
LIAIRRRSFVRPPGVRPYRRLFVVSVEGIKTEPDYFNILKVFQPKVEIRILAEKFHVAPDKVLQRVQQFIRNNGLRSTDEAWVVVDKDQWSDEQLEKVFKWSNLKLNYGLALSNPKFEFWLLLHFEDGKGIATSQDCSTQLKRYLPHYDKRVDTGKISLEQVREAIRRAKVKDKPPCSDWPRSAGGTTVYRLIQKILEEKS